MLKILNFCLIFIFLSNCGYTPIYSNSKNNKINIQIHKISGNKEINNLIVQKLIEDPNAFGIFGFSYLDQNTDAIQGAVISDFHPTFDNITSGKYPVSRSLWFYVKLAHLEAVPGIKIYLNEI